MRNARPKHARERTVNGAATTVSPSWLSCGASALSQRAASTTSCSVNQRCTTSISEGGSPVFSLSRRLFIQPIRIGPTSRAPVSLMYTSFRRPSIQATRRIERHKVRPRIGNFLRGDRLDDSVAAGGRSRHSARIVMAQSPIPIIREDGEHPGIVLSACCGNERINGLASARQTTLSHLTDENNSANLPRCPNDFRR